MDPENQETLENQEGNDTVDPWELAFEAVNKNAQETSETASTDGRDTNTSQSGNNAGIATNASTEESDNSTDANKSADEYSAQIQSDDGGSNNIGGEHTSQDDGTQEDMLGVSNDEIESYRQSIVDSIQDRTIREVAEAYIKKGARHTNGKLGATVEDSDICKRDADGVPHFYNPDTGKEFTGDNPRRQAQEWVDDYNKALANNFNATCRDYSQKLLQDEEPMIAVMEFAPKYDQLDPVRKAMFDNLVEDYEIKDKSGEIVGYSCDLNKALEAVNRQVRSIQEMRKSNANTQQLDTTSIGTGPALDMKASAPSSTGLENGPSSLAEALERQQDQLLASMQKGN